MTAHSGRKIIAINAWWGGIFATSIASVIVGGIAYAFSAHAQLAVINNDLSTLKAGLFPERVARIEQKLDSQAETLRRIEQYMENQQRGRQ